MNILLHRKLPWLCWGTWALSLLLIMPSESVAQTTAPAPLQLKEKPELRIETAKSYIKGFPAIIKIHTTGPMSYRIFSLFSPVAPIYISLVSKKDGQEFSLTPPSGGRSNFTFGNSSGQMFSGENFSDGTPYVNLPSSQAWRTDLFDITTIGGEGATSLDQIPSGDYEMRVVYPLEKLGSPSVEVTIRDSSDNEKAYLSQVKARIVDQFPLESRRYVQARPFREWDYVLTKNVSIADIDEKRIGQDAKDALSLYKIYSLVLAGGGMDKAIEELKQDKGRTSGHLKDVFDSLLIELRLLRNKNDVLLDEIKKFVVANPALEWRIRAAQSGQSDFLKHIKPNA